MPLGLYDLLLTKAHAQGKSISEAKLDLLRYALEKLYGFKCAEHDVKFSRTAKVHYCRLCGQLFKPAQRGDREAVAVKGWSGLFVPKPPVYAPSIPVNPLQYDMR